MRHPEAIWHDVYDVLVSRERIGLHIDPEESVNVVLGVQSLEHPMCIKAINIEAPEHLPTPKVVEDLQQRLFLVALHKPQGHARLVEIVDLPLHRVELAGLMS